MKRTFYLSIILVLSLLFTASTCKEKTAVQDSGETSGVVVPSTQDPDPAAPTVYFTSDISAKGLVSIYEALGVPASGRVAVKISTGESSKSNHLRPDLIKDLVQKVNGNLVECNTAYGGSRSNTASHLKAIEERGFNDIATVDIMDAEGTMDIPVSDSKWIKYDRVGSHLQNYDFMINWRTSRGTLWEDSEECSRTRASASPPRPESFISIPPAAARPSGSTTTRTASSSLWQPQPRQCTTTSSRKARTSSIST